MLIHFSKILPTLALAKGTGKKISFKIYEKTCLKRLVNVCQQELLGSSRILYTPHIPTHVKYNPSHIRFIRF